MHIQTWTEFTIFKLRYGQRFMSTYINYGTDFFLFSEEVTKDGEIAAKLEAGKEVEYWKIMDGYKIQRVKG